MKPSTITPRRAAYVRDAVAKGTSNRAIARELGVDEATVRNFRKKLRIGMGSPARAATTTSARSGSRPSPAATPEIPELEQLEGELAEIPVDVDADPLQVAKVQHRRWSLALKKLEPAFLRGEVPSSTYSKLADLQAQAAHEIATLSPPAPSDPDTDPETRSLAAETLAKVRALIAAERASQGDRT